MNYPKPSFGLQLLILIFILLTQSTQVLKKRRNANRRFLRREIELVDKIFVDLIEKWAEKRVLRSNAIYALSKIAGIENKAQNLGAEMKDDKRGSFLNEDMLYHSLHVLRSVIKLHRVRNRKKKEAELVSKILNELGK